MGTEPEAFLIDHPAGYPHWPPLSSGLTCLALGLLPKISQVDCSHPKQMIEPCGAGRNSPSSL